ncbi:MAG: hypothetical protein FJ090_11255 [Deltaproteobacteria bacterium]|nr:hypothetical protein [Deltaproteobacteria bacterium]
MSDTEALLDAIDRVRDARGSIELFDALAAEDAAAVATALARFGRHPLAEPVREWLRARGIEGASLPSPAEVALRLGISDLEAHLETDARERARLARSLGEAWQRAERAETVANAYAAILVVVALAAVLGWLAALGVVPILGGRGGEEHTESHDDAPAR